MYTVTFTRPYLTGEDRFNIQRERISARNEQQVRDIFADCEILSVELDKADYDRALESQKNAARVWTCNMHVTAEDVDTVHNLIRKAEDADELQTKRARLLERLAADELTALQYGDHDLGRRVTISGGEVLELGPQSGTEDLPF